MGLFTYVNSCRFHFDSIIAVSKLSKCKATNTRHVVSQRKVISMSFGTQLDHGTVFGMEIWGKYWLIFKSILHGDQSYPP